MANDRLSGGGGNDRLFGGIGRDRLSGGAGDDELNAYDGSADLVDCGAGDDRATVDRRDRHIGCEHVMAPRSARAAKRAAQPGVAWIHRFIHDPRWLQA